MQGYTQKLAWDLFVYLGVVSINFMGAIDMMLLKWVHRHHHHHDHHHHQAHRF